MNTHEVIVKNVKGEIVTMAIEAESLSDAQSKCRDLGLEVLVSSSDNKSIDRQANNNSSPHRKNSTSSYLYLMIGIVVIGILFGLFWSASSPLTKDKVIGLVTFNTIERECFNFYKNEDNYFKDPDSAYIDSSTILTIEHDKDALILKHPYLFKNDAVSEEVVPPHSVILVKVYAKNGLGGYVHSEISCPIFSYYSSMTSSMAAYSTMKLSYELKQEACNKFRRQLSMGNTDPKDALDKWESCFKHLNRD